MAIKVGISGFGRISRVVIRIAMSEPDIEIAGINIMAEKFLFTVKAMRQTFLGQSAAQNIS